MRIALAQVDSVLGDLDANRERARAALSEARGAGADLVVFPELQLSGYALGKTEEVMLQLSQYGFTFALEKRCVPCARQYPMAGRPLPDWVELDGEPIHLS